MCGGSALHGDTGRSVLTNEPVARKYARGNRMTFGPASGSESEIRRYPQAMADATVQNSACVDGLACDDILVTRSRTTMKNETRYSRPQVRKGTRGLTLPVGHGIRSISVVHASADRHCALTSRIQHRLAAARPAEN